MKSDLRPGSHIIALALTLGSVFLAIYFTPYTYYWTDTPSRFYFYIVAITALVICFLLFLAETGPAYIRLADLFLTGWAIACLVSALVNDFFVHNEQLLSFTVAVGLYLVLRNLHGSLHTRLIYLLFVAAVFVFEIVACYQQFQNTNAYAGTFDGWFLQGTLDNSGLLSIFLVSSSSVCLYSANFFRARYAKAVVLTVILLLDLAIALATQSRSAFLCLFIVALFGTYAFYPSVSLRVQSFFRRYSILLVCLVIAVTVGLSFVKGESSLGRLLIWNVSLQHFPDAPILGNGYGSFPLLYSDWQADYFSTHDRPSFMRVADLNYEAFNEPLQVLLETGVTGLVFFLLLIYHVARSTTAATDPGYRIFFYLNKGVLMSILTSSLFSYPFHSTPLLLLFFISLAFAVNLSAGNSVARVGSRVKRLSLMVVALFGGVFLVHFFPYFYTVARWSDTLNGNLPPTVSQKFLSDGVPALRHNGLLLNKAALGFYQQALFAESARIMEMSQMRFINEDTYLYQGLCQQELKQFRLAERALIHAKNMIPNRFRPRYLLVKLYQQSGEMAKARAMATEILLMPIKVPSPEVDDMRREMEIMLGRESAQDFHRVP